VSILPPRIWPQQIGCSYCAASRTLYSVSWHDAIQIKGSVCHAIGVLRLCFTFGIMPLLLSSTLTLLTFLLFFFYFFQNFPKFTLRCLGVRFRVSVWVDIMWNMHDFYWCGVKHKSQIACIMVVAELDWMRIQNLSNRIGCGVKKSRACTRLLGTTKIRSNLHTGQYAQMLAVFLFPLTTAKDRSENHCWSVWCHQTSGSLWDTWPVWK